MPKGTPVSYIHQSTHPSTWNRSDLGFTRWNLAAPCSCSVVAAMVAAAAPRAAADAKERGVVGSTRGRQRRRGAGPPCHSGAALWEEGMKAWTPATEEARSSARAKTRCRCRRRCHRRRGGAGGCCGMAGRICAWLWGGEGGGTRTVMSGWCVRHQKKGKAATPGVTMHQCCQVHANNAVNCQEPRPRSGLWKHTQQHLQSSSSSPDLAHERTAALFCALVMLLVCWPASMAHTTRATHHASFRFVCPSLAAERRFFVRDSLRPITRSSSATSTATPAPNHERQQQRRATAGL